MSDLVSYVMAGKNAALYIEPAIASVLAQTHDNLELIIVDDGSTDQTRAIAQNFARQDSRVKVLSNAGAGVAAARNCALRAMSGDWYAILDADDLIHPERTRLLLRAAAQHSADMVADNLIRFFSGRSDIAPDLLIMSDNWRSPRKVSLHDFQAAALDSSPIPALGVLKPLIRKDPRWNADLAYREELRIGEDQDLYARVIHAGARFVYLPSAYYFYRKHAQSTSHRFARPDVDAMTAAERQFRASLDPQDHAALALSQRRVVQLQAEARAQTALAALRERKFYSALCAAELDLAAVLKVARALGEAASKRFLAGPPQASRKPILDSRQDSLGLAAQQLALAYSAVMTQPAEIADPDIHAYRKILARAFDDPPLSHLRERENDNA